jgi:hypothetical protein
MNSPSVNRAAFVAHDGLQLELGRLVVFHDCLWLILQNTR